MPSLKLGERIRYGFDNTLSRGPLALLVWLALLVAFVIIVISILVWVAGIGGNDSLIEQAWIYLMTTFAVIDADIGGSWSFRLASLVVILCGVFVMSTLIGILTTGIDRKLQKLSRGRSRVIETGHTVILGWTEEIITLIQELLIANENKPQSCIAILANIDKVEMDTRISETFALSRQTRIVCRTGDPTAMKDLEIVSPNTSKSIIVLEPSGDSRGMEILKTALAILNNPKRQLEPYHIVTSTNDQKVIDGIKLISKDEFTIIHGVEFVSKIVAQTVVQPGLPIVLTNLLDFEGDEIYFKEEPDLVGKTYYDTCLAYDTSAVIGFQTSEGEPLLNPPGTTVLGEHDQIIAISNDDDTVIMSSQINTLIDDGVIGLGIPALLQSKHILILGWNEKTLGIIKELSNYVAEGSTITVAAESSHAQSQIEQYSPPTNLTVEYRCIDPGNRLQLESLPFAAIDHVVINPCYEIYHDNSAEIIDKLDTDTILVLLNVRDIRYKSGTSLTIMVEILNLKNSELIQGPNKDDFVISDQLITLALSQISENKGLGPVFTSLFKPEGAEIYLKTVTNYVKTDQPVNFFSIVKSALRYNETAIGYRIAAQSNIARVLQHGKEMTYGVMLNPDKRHLINFTNEDTIIVLAEDG
jgi:ion channel POLLUX/CASTOR